MSSREGRRAPKDDPTAGLRKEIVKVLPLIDETLAAWLIPLSRRPLQAALLYVEEIVLEVPTGSKDNPIAEPWFDAIHYETLRWYHRRYGKAMNAGGDSESKGVVVARGVPLSFTFPLSVTGPGSAPGNRRVYFPLRLRDDEDPLSFLDTKFRFTKQERSALSEEIGAVVGQTRSLNRSVRFAGASKDIQRLASRAMWHLSQAVESIAATTEDRGALAVWELNLTTELAVKVLLRHKGVQPSRTHSVCALVEHAERLGIPEFDVEHLNRFPTHTDAIRFRYGELPAPPLPETVELYRSALAVSLHAASHCKGTFNLADDAWIEVRTVGTLFRDTIKKYREQRSGHSA